VKTIRIPFFSRLVHWTSL